ncbi:MAG: PP2C family protein-serine/threonine phosphatase [Beutenbergiaceae bacterium]
MTLSLFYAARSDVGLVRDNNQDSGYAGPHLLVVADGMGGAAAGDIASSVAVAHLAPLDGDEHSGDDLLDLLRDAIAAAHEDLVSHTSETPENAGLGTTVIALLRSGTTAAMVHIGDSRAYLLRDGGLHQVTHDHTFVQHLVDTGQLTETEAESHPQRSILLRVLGDGDGPVELDESIRELHDGDRWLMCSDGLSSYVSVETITSVLSETADPGQCADELVELALRAGGPDNVTVVIADVVTDSTDPGGLPETAPQIVGAAAVDRKAPTRGGDSAAGRAAALSPAADVPIDAGDDDEDELDLDAPAKRRPLFTVLAILVLAAMVAGAGLLGYRWTQTQYYVAPDEDGMVAIYQGVPQSVGPISLSHVSETTAIELSQLPAFVQDRLAAGIAASSLADARDTVAELMASVEPDEEPSPDPAQTVDPTAPSPTGSSTS